MPDQSDVQLKRNYFDDLFTRTDACGMAGRPALEHVAGAYLDGKPLRLGKRKLTRAERDILFWASRPIKECCSGSWRDETMVLSLARYLGQDAVSIEGLLSRVARDAPDALTRAVSDETQQLQAILGSPACQPGPLERDHVGQIDAIFYNAHASTCEPVSSRPARSLSRPMAASPAMWPVPPSVDLYQASASDALHPLTSVFVSVMER